MDPEQLIESYRRQEALFRKAVQDPDQVADEVLLAVCRHDYFDYRSTDEGAVRYCFLELIEHRYGERVYTICYNLSGRNDYRALELRDYVFERLEKKLDSGFLPQFEVRQDFGKYFACTLAYYIRRYLLPDFYSIRAAQNISDYDLMAKKQLVSTTGAGIADEQEMEDLICRFIREKQNGALLTKQGLFNWMCQFPTRASRQALHDDKIHGCTQDGPIENNRSEQQTKAILDEACVENLAKRARYQEVEQESEFRILKLWLKKNKLLDQIDRFQKEQQDWQVIADCQQRYRQSEGKQQALKNNLGEFQQLSYKTLGRVVNSSAHCCYKWRNLLQEDRRDDFKRWHDERYDH